MENCRQPVITTKTGRSLGYPSTTVGSCDVQSVQKQMSLLPLYITVAYTLPNTLLIVYTSLDNILQLPVSDTHLRSMTHCVRLQLYALCKFSSVYVWLCIVYSPSREDARGMQWTLIDLMFTYECMLSTTYTTVHRLEGLLLTGYRLCLLQSTSVHCSTLI